jgi:hypothetical protein
VVKRTIVHYPDAYPWLEWPTGRLLLMPLTLGSRHPVEPSMQTRALTQLVRDNLSKGDVLSMALYHEAMQTGTLQELPDYAETVAIMRDVAPRLGGVMIGQEGGVELSFRYRYPHWTRDDPAGAVGNCLDCAEFIRRVGSLVRECGGTPWFAPMDWDLLQDCYKGGGRIRDALAEVGAVCWTACAFSLVPGAHVKAHPTLVGEQLATHRRWAGRPDGDLPDFRDYLQSGHFWAGLGGIDGIRGGNIEALSGYGFEGFCTKMQEQWIIDALEEERGAEWYL